MDITEYSLLGVLDGISHHRTGRLIPILKYGDDNDPIRLGNVADTFQKRGSVVWFHVPPNVELWTLWTFKVRESPTFDPDVGRSDKYAVDGTPEQINDIIIDNFETIEEARNALGHGVQLPMAPPRRPYVVVGGDRLIGPLELQDAAGRYRLRPSATDPQVDIRTLDPEKVLSVKHAGHEWTFLFPAGEQGEVLGQLDWGDDTAVLRRALRLVEKYEPARLGDVQLTDKIMRRLAESVSATDMNTLERSRIDRALQIISKTIVSKGVAEKFQAEIVALPSVRQMLESDREQARTTGKQDALRDAAEQLESYRGELGSLQTQVTALQLEKSKLIDDIKKVREHQRKVADELETEVQERIEQVATSPAKVLADVVLLRPFLRQLGGSLSLEADAANHAVVPSSRECGRITDETAIRRRVDDAFQAAGYSMALGREIHAAFLSGLVPCVMGQSALQVVQTYATAVFCGVALEVTMNAGLLSPEQVLDQGSIQPLRSFLHRAQKAEVMHLVIFEGANRSLIDSALLPLLRAASTDPPFVQTFGSWPRNAAALVTLCPSAATLRPPDEFWNIVAVIDTNTDEVHAPASNNISESQALVPSGIWREAVAPSAVVPGKWRGWVEKKAPINSPTLYRRADRFEVAMRKLENDEVHIVGATLLCCFGAVIAGLGEKQREALMGFPTFKEKLQIVCRDIAELVDVDER